jgi:hypothetical protein
VPDADRALADIAERGSRAAIVGAAVLRLAAEPETGRLTPEGDRNTM